MTSGIDVLGLVLAILPLVIEGAKVYHSGVNDIKDIAIPKKADERLEEFYELFLVEVTLLECQLHHTIRSLVDLSDERKQQLVRDIKWEDWEPDKDVAQSLQALLGIRYEAYLVVIRRVTRILGHLIKDKTINVDKEETEQEKLNKKLKAFHLARKTNTTSSTLLERFRFWKDEDRRNRNLVKLKECNQSLRLLTEKEQPIIQKAEIATSDDNWQKILYQLRVSAGAVYAALSERWICDCPVQHEAKLCLKPVDELIQAGASPQADFDVLFWIVSETGVAWKESRIMVKTGSMVGKPQQKTAFSKICEAIQAIPESKFCLHVLVENIQGKPSLWQLRPQPRKLAFLHHKPPISLGRLLATSTLPLPFVRELALTLAVSLLGFHEKTWLRDSWSKENITFFYSAEDRVDYEKPFVTTYFKNVARLEELPSHMCHGNPRILALGILLLELHKGKPIESFRTDEDKVNGQVNAYTDFLVASRETELLDDCSMNYKDAVQACLHTPWVNADEEVSLEDHKVREGVYLDVVQPLKDELVYLFRRRFS